MKDSPATLVINGKSYAVNEFNSQESINEVMQFHVMIYHPGFLDISSLLDSPVSLNFRLPQQNQRCYQLIVQSIAKKALETESVYQLRLTHPLDKLRAKSDSYYFVDTTPLTAVRALMEPVCSLRLNIDVSSFNEYRKPLLRMADSDNELTFIERLLSECGCFYYIEDSGTVVLANDSTRFPYLTKKPWVYTEEESALISHRAQLYAKKLIYRKQYFSVRFDALDMLNAGKRYTTTLGAPPYHHALYFYDIQSQAELGDRAQLYLDYLTSQCYSLHIKSTASDLRIGHLIDIDFAGEIQTFQIIALKQHFKLDAKVNYHNQLKLLPQSVPFRAALTLNHQRQALTMATIVAHLEDSPIDQHGCYYFNFAKSIKHRCSAKTPSRTISILPYAGYQRGLHYPLKVKSHVLIGFLGNHPNCPIIITSVQQNQEVDDDLEQKRYRFSTCHHQYLNFVDNDNHSLIDFAVGESRCQLTSNGKQSAVLLNSAGKLKMSAGRRLGFYASNQTWHAANHIDIQAYRINGHCTQGHFTIKALSFKAYDTPSFFIDSGADIDFNAQKLVIDNDDVIEIKSTEGDFKVKSYHGKLELCAKDIIIQSQQEVCLGHPKAFFKLTKDEVALCAKSLTVNALNQIKFQGKMHLAERVKSLSSFKAISLSNLSKKPWLRHDFIPIVDSLSWDNVAPRLSEGVSAMFTLNDFNGDENGFVELYECYVARQQDLQHRPLAHRSPLEKMKKIKVIPFKLESMPRTADARLKITWQPKSLKQERKDKGIIFYRFQVRIQGVTYPNLSQPLQWYKRVTVTVQSAMKVAFAKLHHQCLRFRGTVEEMALIKDTVVFDKVSTHPSHRLYLFYMGEGVEIISADKKSVLPYFDLRVNANVEDEAILVKVFMPPISLFLKHLNKPYLKSYELDYFKSRGHRVTLFIHGFNVAPGHYAPYPKEESPYTISQTVCRTDKDNQATEACAWQLAMERNLNMAAGFTGDYSQFQRLIMIVWPGGEAAPIDYYQSVLTSKEYGERLAAFVIFLYQCCPGIEINIIAHSQGNGVMLKALNDLSLKGYRQCIAHVFFLQAALPYDALDRQSAHAFWSMPNAVDAVKRITVLHSRNDNVVGPLDDSALKLAGLNTVLHRKPAEELIAAIFLTYLDFDSLYQLAISFNAPASSLLTHKGIAFLWQHLRKTYASITKDKEGLSLQRSIEAQWQLYRDKDVLQQLSRQLSATIKRHQTQIENLLKHIDKVLIREEVKWIYILLEHSELLSVILLERDKWHQYEYYHNPFLKAFLKHYQGPLASTLDWVYDKYIAPNLPLILKIAILMKVYFMDNVLEIKPAMGYVGINEQSKSQLGRQCMVVDTTAVILHHSDMKNAYGERLTKIYQQVILNKENGFHFADYQSI